MSRLVLVRHGQSAWNAQNLFTGWRDPPLTAKGEQEARAAGQMLKNCQWPQAETTGADKTDFHFDIAFTSALKRAQHSCKLVLEALEQADVAIIENAALNERDYGDLSGLNKDEARAKWGAEQVHLWRRSYDIAPPGGESLKNTAERVLPYFAAHIEPHLAKGETVLIAAHGNSLRALVMMLEQLEPEAITEVEINTGEPILYDLATDDKGKLSVRDKTILTKKI